MLHSIKVEKLIKVALKNTSKAIYNNCDDSLKIIYSLIRLAHQGWVFMSIQCDSWHSGQAKPWTQSEGHTVTLGSCLETERD